MCVGMCAVRVSVRPAGPTESPKESSLRVGKPPAQGVNRLKLLSSLLALLSVALFVASIFVYRFVLFLVLLHAL